MITNLGKAIYLSTGFFFIFLAYMSCSTITSKIFDDLGYGSLGFTCVALVYLFFGLMSPFSSAFIRKYGSRAAIKAGSFTYFLYIAALLFPTLKE